MDNKVGTAEPGPSFVDETLELGKEAALAVEHAVETGAHAVTNLVGSASSYVAGVVDKTREAAIDALSRLGAIHVSIGDVGPELNLVRIHVEAAIVELARELGA